LVSQKIELLAVQPSRRGRKFQEKKKNLVKPGIIGIEAGRLLMGR